MDANDDANDDDEEMVWYFAYGMNMNAKSMKRREVPFSERVRARIENYTLKFNKAAWDGEHAYANIVPSKEEEEQNVEGFLYRVPWSAIIDNLDFFEGVPDDYERKTLACIRADNHATVEAEVYIAHPNATLDYERPPTKTYCETICESLDESFPRDYIRAIQRRRPETVLSNDIECCKICFHVCVHIINEALTSGNIKQITRFGFSRKEIAQHALHR